MKLLATSKVAPLAVKSITMADPSQIVVAERGRVVITADPLTSSGAGSSFTDTALSAEAVFTEQAINKAENKAK